MRGSDSKKGKSSDPRWLFCGWAGVAWVLLGLAGGVFMRESHRPPAVSSSAEASQQAWLEASDFRQHRTSRRRPATLSLQERLSAWQEAVAKAESAAPLYAGITITSPPSVEREKAFTKLLAGLRPQNAAALHDLLDAQAPGEAATPTDAEWHAFLGEWGRLDGPGAMKHLESHPSMTLRSPGILRGWAAVDPAAAAAWMRSTSAANEDASWRSVAQRELVLGWSNADPDGPAMWLNEHQDLPGYAESAAAFADKIASFEPDSAVDWARSIQGPWADWALQAVGRKWLSEAPEEARAALKTAGCDDDAIERMTAPEISGVDLLQWTGGPDPGASGWTVGAESVPDIHIME